MKIAGQDIPREVNTDVLVLPRGNSTIIIKAEAIADFDEFEAICKKPEAPGILTAKKGFIKNEEDPTYKKRMEQYGLQRVGWMVLKSLVDIEWDRVDEDEPKTWTKWEDDMKEAGFSSVERNLILGLVLSVNSLDEQKLEQARESFIQGQETQSGESASQKDERETTLSGELV